MIRKIVMLLGLVFGKAVLAAPFTVCPNEAFLVQGKIANVYGVNLATGYYSLESDDVGISERVNGMGFSVHDNYLYGWSYAHRRPAKIGNDYQVQPLAVTNITDNNFFVGDVAVDTNTYYVYRRGSNYGLYAISLDENDPNHLQMVRVVDGGTLFLTIYDMAFHPTNGLAYAVDHNGDMFSIDVTTGQATWRSNVGERGTFGAVYFDVNGILYISLNSNGNIYKVDTNINQPKAELFALGPASSTNDGARCATAPVTVSDVTIDFGDAPDSYGTTLDNNGARHQLVEGGVHMGATVDAESDGYFPPLADDTADNSDDEDGLSFVTGFEQGLDAMVVVNASGNGVVSAWFDWNQDGDFDVDEQGIVDASVQAGNNNLLVSVPPWAVVGSTWARFRISDSAGMTATGGVSNGEVEDYQISVSQAQVTTTYYPSENGWVTLAYEDNWPLKGDYDMNDLVVYYRTGLNRVGSNIVGIRIEGEIAAMGAAFHNGFAVNIPGLTRSEVKEGEIVYRINDKLQSGSPLEQGQTGAVVIIADDMWEYVDSGENCSFFRTERGCGSTIQMRFSMDIPLNNAIPNNQIGDKLFDPFMFATDGFFHGPLFNGSPGRSLEIHLKNLPPTGLFNNNYLGLGDDSSDAANNQYYMTSNGVPWALEIGSEWQYPVEFIDIVFAYPLFETFATTSGEEASDWYLPENSNPTLVFTH